MYDKIFESTGQRGGDVLRLEFRLKGKILRELCEDEDGPLDSLDIGRCYKLYRKLVFKLQADPLPDMPRRAAGRVARLLALAQEHDWNANGVPAFELYTLRMSRKQISRLRRQVSECTVEVSNIDWRAHLPEDQLPDAIEVEVD